jgi:hypothetical protein
MKIPVEIEEASVNFLVRSLGLILPICLTCESFGSFFGRPTFKPFGGFNALAF